ncbi:MAG: metallophosphoesterase [Clostridiales bacterium]|nr:metallophosphoesterase [Candidatus Equinaster intestinalis]
MRIIVISDSHGKVSQIDYALQSFPDAKNVFFLGDFVRDIEKLYEFYPDRIFHTVKGNCDFDRNEPNCSEIILAGKRIFFTHGHTLSVKSGTQRLLERAKTVGANIALYGHTHIAKIEYEDGIYLINPGSLSASRDSHNSFCVIEIRSNGILPAIINT